ncbi:polysaccharide deacetylase family protein [Actinoplanes bogorensis]|uniref:Polysaccharide deacetylase family protein n=1 Tax=Paractinoplanes bogorensis TaxID=1610840 RepID=A0ABS5YPH4_9ACTN|nr:polysaccharide deacetylase family protein [Actinoplanes bogorensis]MBU2663900.1 polysaccharide deacetylase family protein [Actinoplanes bogorensis]
MRFTKPLLSAGVAVVALGAFAVNSMGAEAAVKPVAAAVVTALPAAKSGKAAPGGGTAKTLIMYDTTSEYGWLGEVYATQTANLTSHFGTWTAAPVGSYKAGDLNAYTAVVYVGSTYDEPIPAAFLTDVAATTKPVTWIYDNIWQLTATGSFAVDHGFTSGGFDFADVTEVDYKNAKLTRDHLNKSGIMNLSITDASKVKTLASAVRPDGSTFPWAITSGNFTYVGEIPFSYVTHDDRYLAFADLLFDSLGTTGVAREQHRALVRIEDVGPDSDPAELKAVADYLSSQSVPFTVAVYPRYRDPKGVNNGGKAQDYTLLNKPKVVAALKYMQSKGGTLLMHGYTHQYGNVANPYDGVSANDFEFYMAHVDSANNVIYDGPVPGDSAAWTTSRVVASGLVFAAAGLGTPTIFEFPHYAGSAVDYQTINSIFGLRYDRGLYFPGVLTGAKYDYSRQFGQFFPYVVRDVYGSVVIPENIGNVEPESFNNHPARLPSDLLASAERNLVVRDGVASFFYHPYLGTDYLKQVVTGVKSEGYSFVSANSMIGR